MVKQKKGDVVCWGVKKRRFKGIVFDVNPRIAPGSIGVLVKKGRKKEKYYPIKKYVKSCKIN